FLVKSPSRRLGCVPADGGELAIQRHPFFKEIDWQILEERRVRPPFRPKVRSRIDTSNFDKDFTTEEPVLTPSDNSSELAAIAQDVFADFDCFNVDYSVMRYHTTRPSQQQPLQSVIGGLYTSSPTYPNSGSFAPSPPPSTVLSNSPKAMAVTTCESSSSSHVPSTPDPCNPKTNSPLSFLDSGTSCLSHSSCNTSRLTIPSGQISNSSIPPTHSAPTSPTRSHSNITAYGDKAMTKWLAH
ncbi:unnamed protein product, partial [Schistosoma margrebowiei]